MKAQKTINRSIDQFSKFIVAEEKTLDNIKGMYAFGQKKAQEKEAIRRIAKDDLMNTDPNENYLKRSHTKKPEVNDYEKKGYNHLLD